MSHVYTYPHYYALAYRWNTEEECDVVEACLSRWYPRRAERLLDLGCGSGRHLLELAARGYAMCGIDPAPAMVAYAQEQATYRGFPVTVREGTLAGFVVEGAFDAALCLMDTFRFLLTDAAIIKHLQQVSACLHPEGLYLLDFWVPRDPGARPAERYSWEQANETTRVHVDYCQYPDSFDPAGHTFDDELIFRVSEDGREQIIPGGRTRTRLFLPEEFAALVGNAGGWRVRGQYDGFDLQRPYQRPAASAALRSSPRAEAALRSTSWRLVTVLQKES